MRHASARRRLPQLLDGTLPAALEQAVLSHVADCGRCSRRLAELELCERLVARLPLAIVPLCGPASGRRLEGLARWGAPAPRLPGWAPIEGFAVAAAAAALAGVVALAGASHWLPAPEPPPFGLTQVAYVMPAAGPN